MKKYDWRDRDESGDVRYFRAAHHGGAWTFRRRLKDEEDWMTLDPPPVEMLREFRERLWRKYQRRRATWEEIERLDALIEAAGESAGDGTTDVPSPAGRAGGPWTEDES